MKKNLLLLLLASGLFSACEDSKAPVAPDQGYSYFPINTGRIWIYDVDSISYDNNSTNTKIDTFNFQYKEAIVSAFADATGKPAQLVERWFRKSDTLPWDKVNSALVLLDNQTAQKVEENTRFIKMLFPVKQNAEWNGNAYNARGEENYMYDFVNEPYTVNGNTYAQAARIVQTEELNQIEEIRRYEVYAKDVGLIYLQSDSINTQNKKFPEVGTISRGYRYRLKLSSYQP
jgi:hypothetical protein